MLKKGSDVHEGGLKGGTNVKIEKNDEVSNNRVIFEN